MAEIKYVGFDELELDTLQRNQVESLAIKHAEKFSFLVKNDFELVLHGKAYDKTGDRRKFAINARLSYPGHVVNSSKDSWHPHIAVRDSLTAVQKQLESIHGA